MPPIPSRFQTIIDEQVELYGRKRTFERRNSIPPTDTIPLNNRSHWFRIPDVISIFVDMKGSTQLSAQSHESGTAGAYQLFTGTAVDLFHAFDAPYIDVRGDGVFALFNQDQTYSPSLLLLLSSPLLIRPLYHVLSKKLESSLVLI